MAPLLLPCPARRQMAQRSNNQLLGSLPQLGFAMTEEEIERKTSCSKILKSFRGYPVTFNIKGPGCRLAGEVQNEHIRFASRTDYATVILNNLRLLILLSFKSSAIFPISGWITGWWTCLPAKGTNTVLSWRLVLSPAQSPTGFIKSLWTLMSTLVCHDVGLGFLCWLPQSRLISIRNSPAVHSRKISLCLLGRGNKSAEWMSLRDAKRYQDSMHQQRLHIQSQMKCHLYYSVSYHRNI